MKVLLLFVGGCLLFVLAWPVAVLALLLAPFVWLVAWLVSLPFRLLGIVVDAAMALLRGLLMLPARLLGVRG